MLTNSGFDASSDILSLLFIEALGLGPRRLARLCLHGRRGRQPDDLLRSPSRTSTTLALNDVNNPRPGASNYVVPHRFSLRASIGREFFEATTRRASPCSSLCLQEGQPAELHDGLGPTWRVVGFFGRHRLYVPTGPDRTPTWSSPTASRCRRSSTGSTGRGSRPGFVPRNGTHARLEQSRRPRRPPGVSPRPRQTDREVLLPDLQPA